MTTGQHLIQQALETYGPAITSQKPDELSLSSYRVEKPWGYEIWFELNSTYAFKLIHMKAGNKSSLQSHDFKYESNYVVNGIAEVWLEGEDGIMRGQLFQAGMGWTVPIGRKHRVIAITDYTAVEVSTPHLDDVKRYEDDTNRPDGKIEEEHGV